MKLKAGDRVRVVTLDVRRDGNITCLYPYLGKTMDVEAVLEQEQKALLKVGEYKSFYFFIDELEIVMKVPVIRNQSKDEIYAKCEELKASNVPDDLKGGIEYILDRVSEIQEIID